MVVQSISLVTDLRTQNINLGVLYEAAGLKIAGDGSGGTYFWNSTSVAEDDGANVIKVNGVTTGRWVRISEDIKADGIISGGIVTWSGTGLVFYVSPCTYYIGGIKYKTDTTTITLDNGDATYDRIDVFAVNASNQVQIFEGIPSQNPIEPEGDTSTTLGLTNVTITANATTVTDDVTRNLLYDENTESWTRVETATRCSFNPIDPSQKFTGSVSIGATNANAYVYRDNILALDFSKTGEMSFSSYKSLTFAVRFDNQWVEYYDQNTNQTRAPISIQFFNGTKAASTLYDIWSWNNNGFSSNLINQWQFITIAFNNKDLELLLTKFTKVRIKLSGFTNKAWIDTIVLNDGINNPVQPSSKNFGFVSATTGTATASVASDTLSIIGTGLVKTTASEKTVTIDVLSSTSDGIVSGGVVAWKQIGYQYNATPCSYIINGKQYATESTDVILSASDPTLDRIDIIAVNSSNQVVVIEGVPSASPQEPQVDPSSQLQLTTVTVYAGSVTPSNVVTNMIYDENLESWLKVPTGFTADYFNTVTPFSGSYCILATTISGANKVLTFYQTGINTDKNDYSIISFAIKLNQSLLTSESIVVKFFDKTVPVQNQKVAEYSITSNNVVGFNRSNITNYQVISIPISAIPFTKNIFNSITINLITTRTGVSFRFDRLFLQGGVVKPVAVSYLPLSGNSMTGQIVLSKSTSSTDYTQGLKFPDNTFGGAGDTAGIRLYEGDYGSTDDQVLELYVSNDSGVSGLDIINFSAPTNNSVRINNNIIWNTANDGAGSGLDADLLDGQHGSYYFSLPSLTAGSVLFSDGTTIAQDNTNLFWNNSDNKLGIGISSPLHTLDVVGSVRISSLSGTGNRAVVANSTGVLSTQQITSASETIGLTFLLMGA